MKVNLYLDVFHPANAVMSQIPLYATSAPGEKQPGSKRFKIVVDIPDPATLFAGEIDGLLPLEEKVKEVDID